MQNMLSEDRCVMYMMTHKGFKLPEVKGYVPMCVGAANRQIENYMRDDKGENISEKNSNYCELTGLYWLWKNDINEYVGLCHYRRFFTKNRFSKKETDYLKIDEAKDILEEYDVIVPKPKYFVGKTVREYYAIGHFEKDLDITEAVIKEKYPEYINAFEWVMKQKCGYSYNMMITNKLILNEYCKWLFDILFEVEKRIDISDYDQLQARVFGFLSERLLNVWLKHNNLKIHEVPVVNMDESNWVFLRRLPLEFLLNVFDEGCRNYIKHIME